MSLQIFGAPILVYLRYEGNIQDLAKELSKALLIDLPVEREEWPPYDLIGSLEILGWELWLRADNKVESFHFCLKMETESSSGPQEFTTLYDISGWFAHRIALMSNIECLVIGSPPLLFKGREIIAQ